MTIRRRRFAFVLPLFFLSGCANDESDVVQVGSVIVNYVRGLHGKVTREQAGAVPYASMGLELGSSSQILLVLGTISQDELGWYAGDQVFVATRRGRVVRTAGLPYDLGGLSPLSAAAAGGGAAAKTRSASVLLSLDFPDLGSFGAVAKCASRDAGEDTVEIFGASIPTRRIIEHCTVPSLKWSFDNQFWADRMTGYVWRSSQYIHPKSPPLVLEIFRPEQGGG
jgi:hypothetical protein